MKDDSRQSVANSLETETSLLPYMPYLLQDMWALGSAVDLLLDEIGMLKVASPQPQVLDLGCGKGAVSVQIAARYGYGVTGVDAMPSFLKNAHDKAAEFNMSDLCTFIEQDILTYTKENHDFDMVILASLGGIFGSNQQTVATLRSQVKTGGYIIVDDGYLKQQKSINRKGYGHYHDYEHTVKELTALNDQLISEVSTTAASIQINDEYLKVIEYRGRQLIEQHPEIEQELLKYIESQREECDVLNNEIEGMIWVLKKAGE
jgi:ubiquinone/menaquinone biosynthesis C-methylase UbiE